MDSPTDVLDELIRVGRTWATSQHQLVRLAARIDRSDVWERHGASSAAAWIAEVLDVEPGTAHEWVRIGRALDRLSLTEAAFEGGRLSFSKVRALTRVAERETEAELIELAESVPAGQLARAIAAWRSRREAPEDTEARQNGQRRFTSWVDADGMVCGHFRLPPAVGGALVAAVDAELVRHRPRQLRDATAVAPDVRREPLHAQRADALARLFTGEGRVSHEIVIHLRGDGCALDDGTPVPGSVVERIAPESFIRALIHDAEARPINASGRRRHPSTRQKRVVDERDRVCVDCGSEVLHQYDHVPEFDTSGQTVIDELELRCAPCHRRRHRKSA